MQNSLETTPLTVPQRHELRFFKEFSNQCLKKPMKTIKISSLQLILSDLYGIFLEFIHLLYLSSFQSEPLYLSKVMVKRQQFTVFYFYTCSKDTNGFRRIDMGNWSEEVLLFWRVISEVTVSDCFILEYAVLLQEWQSWMGSLQTRERLNWCCQDNFQKQGYLKFIEMLYKLKISRYFSFDVRIKQYLVSHRIKADQMLTEVFSSGSSNGARPNVTNLREEFQAIVKSISKLITLMKQHGFIIFVETERLGLASGSDGEKEKTQKLKSPSNRTSQIYHFLLRINIGQSYPSVPETIYLSNDSRTVEVSRQLIRISISVQRRDRIAITVTTTPYWKLYPLAFANLKAVLQAVGINLAKQQLNFKVRPMLLDFFSLRLSLQEAKEETKISLCETLVGGVERNLCVEQLLQCIEKQLMVWAVLEKDLERACRVYIGQINDSSRIISPQEYLRAQIQKGIQIVDEQLSLLADKCRP